MTIFSSHKKRLQLVGLAEGISLLLLLFICTPLKYILDIKEPTKIVGMIHGLLFILYIVVVLFAHGDLNWKYKRTALLLLASVVPFGTFYADKRVFKQLDA